MSDANPKLGNRAKNLAHLIGEAISDDVDAWDWRDEEWLRCSPRISGLRVTRDGREFCVTVVEVEER